MTKLLKYSDIRIEVMQCTPYPDNLVASACSITQKQSLHKINVGADYGKLIKYLFTANHTSPFEHAYITFLITNVSRSFLAQITRHRMGSFTSASQHYQKYDSYPNVLNPEMISMEEVSQFLEQADAMYSYLISNNIPKEEARQVLPNAKAVNILWTVNARSLINFFNQRLCRRNVEEMANFARRLLIECKKWFPDLFELVGPDCITLGGCTQGRMKSQECIDAEIPDFER